MEEKKPIKAILWFIASLFMSCSCDVISKYLSADISPVQITFVRLFFSSIILLPLVTKYHINGFKVSKLPFHFLRGVIFSSAICIWGYGLKRAPIFNATIIGFTVPIFVNVLAVIFLKEKILNRVWICMFTSFIGVILVVYESWNLSINIYSLYLLLGAFLFALMDILNKININEDHIIFILFYSTFFAALMLFIPSLVYWKPLLLSNVLLMFVLSILGILLFYCIIKAFSLASISFLTPARYLEVIISILFSYLVFDESVKLLGYLGSFIVFASALFMYKKSNFDN